MLSPLCLALVVLALQSDRSAPFARSYSPACVEAEPEGPRTGGDRISAPPVCDPSGTYCAVPLESGEVELHDLASGSIVRWERVGDGKVEGVAFDGLGRTLATWNWSDGVALRAVPSGETKVRLPDRALETWWTRLEFSCDGTRLLTWDGSRAASLWDARTGQLVASLEHERDSVRHAAWNPAGDLIVTCGAEGLRFWDAEHGAPVWSSLQGGPAANHFAFDAVGTRIAVACVDSRVRVLDARTGAQLALVEFERFWPDEHVEVWKVAFDPSGRRLLTTSDSVATAHLWSLDGEPRKVAWKRSYGGGPSGYLGRFEKGGAWVSVSPLDCQQGAELVETATGRTLHRSELGNSSWLTATPDGRWILDARPEELRIYDGRRSQPIYVR